MIGRPMMSSRKEMPTRITAPNQRGHHSTCETNGTLTAIPAATPIPPTRGTGRWCKDRSFGWSRTLSDQVRIAMVNTIHVRAKETSGVTYARDERDHEVIDQERSYFPKNTMPHEATTRLVLWARNQAAVSERPASTVKGGCQSNSVWIFDELT